MRALTTAFLVASALFAAPSSSKIRVLGPGVYYRKEVPKDTGGNWMALVKEDGAWSMKAIQLVATSVPMEGDRGSRKSGVEVQAKDFEDALLLVKGLPEAVLGAISLAASQSTHGESIHDQRSVGTFQGEAFVVWSEELSEGKDYVLRLQHGGCTQMLFVERNCDECSWDLLWAGDLDQDGKLDLLMAASGEESQGSLRLFLSSHAQEHQKVGLAGMHRWTFGD